MKRMKPTIYNDKVSKCDIMLNVKGEMYIIRDGKKRKLNAFIIKERAVNDYESLLNSNSVK